VLSLVARRPFARGPRRVGIPRPVGLASAGACPKTPWDTPPGTRSNTRIRVSRALGAGLRGPAPRPLGIEPPGACPKTPWDTPPGTRSDARVRIPRGLGLGCRGFKPNWSWNTQLARPGAELWTALSTLLATLTAFARGYWVTLAACTSPHRRSVLPRITEWSPGRWQRRRSLEAVGPQQKRVLLYFTVLAVHRRTQNHIYSRRLRHFAAARSCLLQFCPLRSNAVPVEPSRSSRHLATSQHRHKAHSGTERGHTWFSPRYHGVVF
jgi:hypothetical protein